MTPKVATIEIQHLVLRKLNESVAFQLVQSVGCLHESFTGTLQRCLESLEKSCHVLEGGFSASNAVQQIVTAAYNIDLNSPTSFSVTHNLMDKLKMLLTSFILPWSSNNQIQCNFQWQLQVATNMIDRLNATKLAKTICMQVSIQSISAQGFTTCRNYVLRENKKWDSHVQFPNYLVFFLTSRQFFKYQNYSEIYVFMSYCILNHSLVFIWGTKNTRNELIKTKLIREIGTPAIGASIAV